MKETSQRCHLEYWTIHGACLSECGGLSQHSSASQQDISTLISQISLLKNNVSRHPLGKEAGLSVRMLSARLLYASTTPRAKVSLNWSSSVVPIPQVR